MTTKNMSLNKALHELAIRKDLLAKPFRPRRVSARAVFGSNGLVSKVIVGGNFQLPVEEDRSNDNSPNFGYDSLKWTVSIDFKPDVVVAPSKWFNKFWEIFRDGLSASGDSQRASLAEAVLKAGHEKVEKSFVKMASKANLKLSKDVWITVEFEDDLKPTILLPHVSKQWEKIFEDRRRDPKNNVIANCMITGKRNVVCGRLFPKARGVPGAQKVPLTSYNQAVFEYEGRPGGANFPVEIGVAIACSNAFSWLFQSEKPRNYRAAAAFALGESRQYVVAAWGDTDHSDIISQAVLNLLTPPFGRERDEVVASFARDVELLKQNLNSEGTVYVLGFSGSQGRVAITEWYPTSIKTLCASVLAALELVPELHPYGIISAIRSLIDIDLQKKKKVPAMILFYAARMMINIMAGKPWTSELKSIMSHFISRSMDPQRVSRPLELISQERHLNSKSDEPNIYDHYNKDDPMIGYHMGALVAIMDRLQLSGRRGLKTNSDYSSKLPKVMMCPRTIADLQVHACHYKNRAKKERYSRVLLEVFERINIKLHEMGLPVSLDALNKAACFAGFDSIGLYLKNYWASFRHLEDETPEVVSESE